MINSNSGTCEKSNKLSIKNADKTTIATFTKLLLIKIAANKYSGFSCNLKTRLSASVLAASISLRCCGVREKKPTSEADIKAETPKSRTMISNVITCSKVNGKTITAFSNR